MVLSASIIFNNIVIHCEKTMILQKNTYFILGVSLFTSLVFADSTSQEMTGDERKLHNFQHTVSGASTPLNNLVHDTVRIALIYPSADISDFWIKNYQAMVARLEELNVSYVADEFPSRQIEHALQSRYVDEVIHSDGGYDFVIFGPSELNIQANNIQELSARTDFKTFIWAFHTPNPNWESKPDAWFDFSSSMGAEALCDALVNGIGSDILFAMNRGIPGVTDTQRSQYFSNCVEDEGDWINMYEHFGQYQKTGGIDGANLVVNNFPEVTVLHNANTAMTMGAIEALDGQVDFENLLVTGWGGTAKEIEQIKSRKLYATPMRMSDDVGVATAEAIKYYLQDREAEIPNIYLGRITVVNRDMSHELIDNLSKEAFRYSGEN